MSFTDHLCGPLARAARRRGAVAAWVLMAVVSHTAVAQDSAVPPGGSDNPAGAAESVAARAPIEDLVSNNLLQLRENAEVVFVGTLAESELVSGRQGGVMETRYVFEIESYLKGERPEDRISLRNLGGRSEATGKTMSTPFSFEFAVGQRYLVFLRPGFEELALPIIEAFSILEGGEVVAGPSGHRLLGVSPSGEMIVASEAAYDTLDYGPEGAISPAPAPTEAPPPDAGSAEVQINPALAPAESLETAAGVSLEDIGRILR